MTDEKPKPEEKPDEKPEEVEEKEESAEADSSDLIAAANKAAERLETANNEMARLIAIQRKETISRTLDGKATAGIPSKSKDEKEREDAKKMLEGTGFGEELFPDETKGS